LLAPEPLQPVMERRFGLKAHDETSEGFGLCACGGEEWAEVQSCSAACERSGVTPSVFTAVTEQLGLKLEPTKAAVDFLVIDEIQRPSEN